MIDENRVEQLEKRISDLESEIGMLKRMYAEELWQSSSPQKKRREEKPVVPPSPPPKPMANPSKKPETDYEQLLGQVWLPRVFIIVLILGVLWGFKAMGDNGFLNKPVRITMGYLASIVLVWLGERQIKKMRVVLGQVFLGASVVILILATFAASVLYGLLSPYFALFLNILWTALGIFISHRHGSEPIAILSSLAGFLVPFLTEGVAHIDPVLFVGYEVLFYIALLCFSLSKKYIGLYFASAILLHLSLLGYCFISMNQFASVVVFGVLIQHIVILAALLGRNVFFKVQKGTMLASFAVTQLWVFMELHNRYSIFLAASIVLYAALTGVFYRNSSKLRIMVPILTYAVSMYLLDVIGFHRVGVVLIIEGVISLYVAFSMKDKIQSVLAIFIYLSGGMLILFAPIEKVLSYETFSWLILIPTLFAIRRMMTKFNPLNKAGMNTILEIVFWSISACLLIFLTELGLAATEGRTGNVRHSTISAIWTLYSVSGVVLGVFRESKKIRILGIALLFLTLSKVIFYDIENISMFVRSVLFIGLGVVGLGLSRLFYTKRK